MNDELLRKPRKKRWGRDSPISPFPVPVASITGTQADDSRWHYYFGKLKSDHVAVYRKGDLIHLYKLGFFGKGMLSKNQPLYESCGELSPGKHILSLNLEVEKSRLIKERLRQHNLWAAEKRGQSLHVDEDSNVSTDIAGCVEIDLCEVEQPDEMTDGEDSMDESLSTSVHEGTSESLGQKRTLPPQEQEEKQNKMLKMEDSYKLFEYLQLTYEEAFFLSYGLGCLSVDDGNLGMNVGKMWNTFLTRKHDFLHMYIAYHHFRSKGWIVRFSNLFGADFVLYQDGMPFYHASYAVFVKFVNNDQHSSFSWKEISCIGRVNEKIAKEVLVCYVIAPKGFSKDDLPAPCCIKKFRIMEMIVRRWLPEKYRELVVS